MKRIDTATKHTDLFGAGKHGYRNGDLGLGVAPTQLDAAALNHMQEEIARVIEAGGIALDGATYNQLLLALRAAGVFTTPATGDRTTKAATTAMFTNEFASSFGASGYQKLPTGLILQWGSALTDGSGVAVVSLPITFPTATRGVWAMYNGSTGPTTNRVVGCNSPTASSFTLYAADNAGAAVSATINWFALGH